MTWQQALVVAWKAAQATGRQVWVRDGCLIISRGKPANAVPAPRP